MYVEIESTFFKILFWVMWYLTDAIILFFAIVFLLNVIQEHKKYKREKRNEFLKNWCESKEKVDDK